MTNAANLLDYTSTHRDIVQSCQSGNRQAQYELYQLYSKAMYNICLRMVRNENDAEDILQHSFMDVFHRLDTFRFQSSIGAWIKRIVINNCINFLKKRRLHFDELEERHAPAIDGQVETEAGFPFSVQEVKQAIVQLPEGYRVVFNLYLMEGYDHKEIAGILGISEATSKSQYSRAKKKIRELLMVRN